MDRQIETIFGEIMVAIETATLEATTDVINRTDNSFHNLLVHTGEMYAGCIGKHICLVFKKYTEDDG